MISLSLNPALPSAGERHIEVGVVSTSSHLSLMQKKVPSEETFIDWEAVSCAHGNEALNVRIHDICVSFPYGRSISAKQG
jgi:hypothetical protein